MLGRRTDMPRVVISTPDRRQDPVDWDFEAAAMNQIAMVFETLPDDARLRVLQWAASRYLTRTDKRESEP